LTSSRSELEPRLKEREERRKGGERREQEKASFFFGSHPVLPPHLHPQTPTPPPTHILSYLEIIPDFIL
jgi:hypothetical protein